MEKKKRRRTESEVKEWEEAHGWLVGSNFNPGTAINQLETWQKETFDPETTDRELWFHEIFRADGTPYMKEETELIRELTGSSKK